MIFAPEASDAFNLELGKHLHQLGVDVAEALGPNLEALILGGGYGRGEGGVVQSETRERPYNDLDLFLVLRRKRRNVGEALHSIRESYANELGIDVDFSRPVTTHDIERWPHWLMWHDLLDGHLVLAGEQDVLTSHAPRHLRKSPPPVEALRLLLNRGAGLLWALRVVRGVEPAPEGDFVRRNYYKCIQACGDALLLVHRRYTPRCAGRTELFAELVLSLPSVRAMCLEIAYAGALRFKLRPDSCSSNGLGEKELRAAAGLWGRVLLHVEERRAGRRFPTARDYVLDYSAREVATNTFRCWPANLVRNLRRGVISVKYPREELYRELPQLLGLTAPGPKDWTSRSARFLALWRQVN